MNLARFLGLISVAVSLRAGDPEVRGVAPDKIPELGKSYIRTQNVLYGSKFGRELTLDIFKPASNSNGCGIIYVVSGGWASARSYIEPFDYTPFLERGYSVFAVVHGSQPKFTIPEIIPDVRRAVRFIRHNAAEFGIDGNRLGITGVSSGGYLSLVIGTQGAVGDPKALDPADKESSSVEAVACFFPPTDFLNFGGPGIDAVGIGPLAQFRAAFGDASLTPQKREEFGRRLSPANLVSKGMTPTLIIQGDADTIVPSQQAYLFVSKARAAGGVAEVILRPGGHGWPDMNRDRLAMADWFDIHLRGISRGSSAARLSN